MSTPEEENPKWLPVRPPPTTLFTQLPYLLTNYETRMYRCVMCKIVGKVAVARDTRKVEVKGKYPIVFFSAEIGRASRDGFVML